MKFYYLSSVLILSACLWLYGCGKDSSKSSVRTLKATERITASQAIESARKIAQSPEWKLAFISNTGVAGGSVTSSQFRTPEEGLMLPDGTAGQWVVEFFKDSPTPVSEDGRTGKSYPFRRISVTAQGNNELPEANLKVPKKLSQLKMEYINALDTARNLAIMKFNKGFDVMSVASNVNSVGDCSWMFRFYDLKKQKIIDGIRVSGDGTRILRWE